MISLGIINMIILSSIGSGTISVPKSPVYSKTIPMIQKLCWLMTKKEELLLPILGMITKWKPKNHSGKSTNEMGMFY